MDQDQDEDRGPLPNWSLLSLEDWLELEITGLRVVVEHLANDMTELAARVSELESQRAMDEED